MTGDLAELKTRLAERTGEVEDWFRRREATAPPLFYASVDLRHSAFKAAPVDTNLFPAGFNNLCESQFQRAARSARDWLAARHPGARRVAVLAEDHSRNPFYEQNLRNLSQVLAVAGLEPVIVPLGKEGPERDLTAGGSAPDLILLNNDLSAGLPTWLAQARIPVLPHPGLGWHARRKSAHQRVYREVAADLAGLLDVDPWLLCVLSDEVDDVDFQTGRGLDLAAERAGILLGAIADKYREHGIPDQPYLFVKHDSGTYGMGIMNITDPGEILTVNRKTRNKMSVGKANRPIRHLILEEGLPTVKDIQGCPAEPVIYLVGGRVAGGFYRINCTRTLRQNLNAKGMDFFRYCLEPMTGGLPSECACGDDDLLLYETLGRLAGLAAAEELARL